MCYCYGMCGRQIVLKDFDLHGAGVQRNTLVHLCIVGTEIYNAEVVFQHMIDVFITHEHK